MRIAIVLLLLLAAAAASPEVAHACPVCFDASDENRQAFFATTVFLTLLPLGMVGGAGLWLRHRARERAEQAGSPEEPRD